MDMAGRAKAVADHDVTAAAANRRARFTEIIAQGPEDADSS
jgi:hypothetical protein